MILVFRYYYYYIIIFHYIAVLYTVSVIMDLMFFNQIRASLSSAYSGIKE